MKVNALIKQLQKLPKDAYVLTWDEYGNDCNIISARIGSDVEDEDEDPTAVYIVTDNES